MQNWGIGGFWGERGEILLVLNVLVGRGLVDSELFTTSQSLQYLVVMLCISMVRGDGRWGERLLFVFNPKKKGINL